MPSYRDFYRDIGFDLDFDYVKPYLPASDQRGFTGIKYHRITGDSPDKAGLRSRRRAANRGTVTRSIFSRRAWRRFARSSPAVMDRPPLVLVAVRRRIVWPLVV